MIEESPPQESPDGLVPQPGGWYVINAREARWRAKEGRFRYAWIEPEDEEWPTLGVNVMVLDPGTPMANYHAESLQEGFLVVSGECLLLIEGQERTLRPWDYVHCPPDTEHVLIGGVDGAVVVAVGARADDDAWTVRYPVTDLAVRHGAAAPFETTKPSESYSELPPTAVVAYRDGDLPDVPR